MQLLIAGVAILVGFLAISTRYQANSAHRAETHVLVGSGTLVLLVLLAGYGLSQSDPDRATSGLRVDDYVLLANAMEQKGELDRAINMLEHAETLTGKDERYDNLEQRIKNMKTKQVAVP